MRINQVYDFDGPSTIPNGFDFKPWFNKLDKDLRPLEPENLNNYVNDGYRIIAGVSNAFQNTYTVPYYTYELTDEFINNHENDVFIYILKVREMFDFSFKYDSGYYYKDDVTLIDTISTRVKNLVKNKNFYIYIEYTWEGQFPLSYFHKIYYDLRLNKIPANKVIFCTNTQNILELHTYFLSKFPKDKKIKFTHFNQCLIGKRTDYFDKFKKNSFVDESFLDKIEKRNKKTLILNRRLRIHRIAILTMLLEDGLYGDTLTSFDMQLLLHHQNPLHIILDRLGINEELILDDKTIEKILSGYKTLNELKKSTIDYDNLDDVIGLGYESKSMYENTYFSTVTETLFVEKEKFVSEKTYKPILHYHPFVIVGSANTLKYLKSYGFKTFDKWWDESYDSILDNGKRLMAVYSVIKELIQKSDEEWIQMLTEMKDILKYNKELLLSFIGPKLSNIIFEQTFKIINDNGDNDIQLF